MYWAWSQIPIIKRYCVWLKYSFYLMPVIEEEEGETVECHGCHARLPKRRTMLKVVDPATGEERLVCSHGCKVVVERLDPMTF